MENFKIIKSSLYPDVLVRRDRNENSEEIVNINCFGNQEETEDLIFEETILFHSPEESKSFIKLFDENWAEEFCKRQKIDYK